MQAASARTYQDIYLPFGRLGTPSLLTVLISFPTLSDARGAPRDAVTIVGVVVVGVTVVVDISKIGRGRGQRRSTKVQANSSNQYSTQPI